MKNLNIGGSIYQNVERLYLKDENGRDVVYVDGEVIKRTYASARFVGYLTGDIFKFPLAAANRHHAAARVTQEV